MHQKVLPVYDHIEEIDQSVLNNDTIKVCDQLPSDGSVVNSACV